MLSNDDFKNLIEIIAYQCTNDEKRTAFVNLINCIQPPLDLNVSTTPQTFATNLIKALETEHGVSGIKCLLDTIYDWVGTETQDVIDKLRSQLDNQTVDVSSPSNSFKVKTRGKPPKVGGSEKQYYYLVDGDEKITADFKLLSIPNNKFRLDEGKEYEKETYRDVAVVFVFQTGRRRKNYWEEVVHKIRTKNLNTQVILICENIHNLDYYSYLNAKYFFVLNGEWRDSKILASYAYAAARFYVSRDSRRQAFEALANITTDSVRDTAEAIVKGLELLVGKYDFAKLVRVSSREYLRKVQTVEYLDSLIRTNLYEDPKVSETELPQHVKKYQRPIKDDKLLKDVLGKKSGPYVYPNPRVTFDGDFTDVGSWICLPLWEQESLIGLITVDSKKPNTFNFNTVSEATLVDFASQAAFALRATEERTIKNIVKNILDYVNNGEEIIKIICGKALEFCQACYVAILIPDHINKELKILADYIPAKIHLETHPMLSLNDPIEAISVAASVRKN